MQNNNNSYRTEYFGYTPVFCSSSPVPHIIKDNYINNKLISRLIIPCWYLLRLFIFIQVYLHLEILVSEKRTNISLSSELFKRDQKL